MSLLLVVKSSPRKAQFCLPAPDTGANLAKHVRRQGYTARAGSSCGRAHSNPSGHPNTGSGTTGTVASGNAATAASDVDLPSRSGRWVQRCAASPGAREERPCGCRVPQKKGAQHRPKHHCGLDVWPDCQCARMLRLLPLELDDELLRRILLLRSHGAQAKFRATSSAAGWFFVLAGTLGPADHCRVVAVLERAEGSAHV